MEGYSIINDRDLVSGQAVYSALMAFVVERHRGSLAHNAYDQAREHGQGEMLLQAAMVAFGEDMDAAEMRIAEDYAERMANRY